MSFIKNNPALAAGIGLPVLLVVLFGLAALIPQWLVAPPQHNILVSMDRYDRTDDYETRFRIVQGRLVAEARKKPPNLYHNNPRLFVLDVKTGNVREILFDVPAAAIAENTWQTFPVPGLEDVTLDAAKYSPDGYEFRNRSSYNSGGFPFFYGSSHRQRGIYKDGRMVSFDWDDGRRYNIYNAELVGWIVEGTPK